MRKKFTMLLASLFLFGIGTMSAEVTKYYKPGERKATLAVGDKVMFYNTTIDGDQDRTGFLVDGGTNLNLSKQKPSTALLSEKCGVWTLEVVEANDTYYKVNVKGNNGYVGIGGATNNTEVKDLYIHHWTTADANAKATPKSENAEGVVIENAEITVADKIWLVANAATEISTTWNGNTGSFSTWGTGHPYAIYSIVEAETADLEEYLAAAKVSAKASLADYAKLSISSATAAITQIDAVTMANNDLETALKEIDALVLGAKNSIDGKSVKFLNCGTDARGGRYLGYDKGNSRIAALGADGDDVIWTIKVVDENTFKLYNFVNNIWLGGPDYKFDVRTVTNEQGESSEEKYNYRTPAIESEADAVAYKFVVKDNEKAALVTNTSKGLHVKNGDNYRIMEYWNTDDDASKWNITEEEILISREQYDLAAAAKAALPYAIQEAYGLVTDASKFSSNAKESAEGSYEGLLDNAYNDPSFFHSSYNTAIGEYHYLQAEVNTEVKDFYFYFKKRQGNNANRPTKIVVKGSADGNEYTEITTIESGLPTEATDIDYLSAKITASNNVKYLRFVVESTNTNAKDGDDGHPFFTFSEFYIFPATPDVTSLVTSFNAFVTTSITNNEINDVANNLINAGTMLALANLKKEINVMLTANVDNHAETPALGQYTTVAYNALNTAYSAADATQQSLEAAIATFNASKNLPVFTITGVKDYVVGKSIYDDNDGTLNFKTTNVYDKTMWWALDMTETTVGVTEKVDIYNVGTGNGFWGTSSIKITETSENDGAGIADDGIFLFYTTGSTTPVHFQDANQQIVRWSSTEATSGSAAKFVYIGSTYDLNKYTEEYLAKGMELADVVIPNYVFGTGMNQYSEKTSGALASAKEKVSVTLTDFVAAEDIAAAKVQLETALEGVTLNMPVQGRFYRIRCTDGNKRLLSTLNEDGSRMTLANTLTDESIFYYTENGLLSYKDGQFINAYNLEAVGAKTGVEFTPASTGTVGCYNVKVNDRWIYGTGDNVDSGTSLDNRAGYRWWLEEVTTLPVTVTAAGYATLYAPVALTVAENVNVYTAEVAGDYVTLSDVATTIPANTGVIIKAAEGTYDFNVADDVDAIENNDLKGSYAKSVKNAEMNVYTLQAPNDKVGFYLFNGTDGTNTTYINGFRAWIELPTSSNVRALSIGRGEGTTSIDELSTVNGQQTTVIYDLTGRRVEKMEKGIYIVNGRKVVIK